MSVRHATEAKSGLPFTNRSRRLLVWHFHRGPDWTRVPDPRPQTTSVVRLRSGGRTSPSVQGSDRAHLPSNTYFSNRT